MNLFPSTEVLLWGIVYSVHVSKGKTYIIVTDITGLLCEKFTVNNIDNSVKTCLTTGKILWFSLTLSRELLLQVTSMFEQGFPQVIFDIIVW